MSIYIEFQDEVQLTALFDFIRKERLIVEAGFIRNQNNEVDEPLNSPRHKRLIELDDWLKTLKQGLRRERRLENGQLVFEWFELREE